jgi:formylglycine-generating enzyme required for sulfatase activity
MNMKHRVFNMIVRAGISAALFLAVVAWSQPGGPPFSPVSGPPAAPEAPVVTPGHKRLTLSWAAVSGAASYDVFWAASGADAPSSDNVKANSFIITGLENGTVYSIYLRAKNSQGQSAPGPAAAGTPALTAPRPSVVRGNGTLSVGWAADAGVAYQVWYGSGEDTTPNQLGAVSPHGTNGGGDITGLSNGSLYYVRLKAQESGETDWTDFGPASQGTPQAPPASVPEGFVYVPGGLVAGSDSWAMTLTVPNDPHYNNPGLVSTHKGVFVEGRVVLVDSFFMAKHETTRQLWWEVQEWATSNGYVFQNSLKSAPDASGKDKPITNINWRDAVVWCNASSEKSGLDPEYYYNGAALKDSRDSNAAAFATVSSDTSKNGFRLPTEAEREFAARGGDPGKADWVYTYAGSDDADTVAWHYGNAANVLKAAGEKTANRLGIYDLSGNAMEWGWDWMNYGVSVTKDTPLDGASYSALLSQKPMSGGSSGANPTMSSVVYRWGFGPSYKDGYVGFRVVRKAE